MAQLWRAQVSGGAAIWAAVNGDGAGGVSTIGAVTQGETSLTFAYAGSPSHYRVYETGDTPGSWVSIGASPVTVSSLTVNTPYTIEISDDGSTVADSVETGTLNPGEGGGGVGTLADVTPASGAATAGTLAGRSNKRATISAATGAATSGTLAGAGIQPGTALLVAAAGASTASTLAGAARVRASITAAAGVATTATLSGEVAGAPTLTIRVLDKAEAGSPLASSTGWDCFWYDSATTMAEAVATTPTVSLPGQSADSLGRLVLTLAGSSKGSGEYGFLMFSNGDGSTDQSPPPRSFAALVPVD